MSERDDYPAGVPCWVEVCSHDTAAARDFYGAIFGWAYDGPGPMPGGGDYWVARVRGRDVCGISTVPESVTPCWNSFVAVDDAAATLARARELGATVLCPATPAPPAGTFAMLTDPGGAVLGLWQADARDGAYVVNEPSAWSMSRLQTPDAEQAVAFYGALFGWEVEMFGEVGMFRRPGYVGGLPEQPVPRDVVAVFTALQDGSPRWSVDFWADDVERVVGTARERGGSVLAGPYDVPLFKQAVVADPAGATFSVSQLVG